MYVQYYTHMNLLRCYIYYAVLVLPWVSVQYNVTLLRCYICCYTVMML